MKKLILVSFVTLFSAGVHAFAFEAKTQEHWYCYAQGFQNVGFPGGTISLSFRGEGDSQMDAMSDAQQQCFGQGLSMCRIDHCAKR